MEDIDIKALSCSITEKYVCDYVLGVKKYTTVALYGLSALNPLRPELIVKNFFMFLYKFRQGLKLLLLTIFSPRIPSCVESRAL